MEPLSRYSGDIKLVRDGIIARLTNIAPGEKEGDAVEFTQLFAAIAAAMVAGGAGTISLTYAQLGARMTAGTVVAGQTYLITDKGAEGIIVRGATSETVSTEAILNALNADYQLAGDYSGIPSAGTNIGIWRSNRIRIYYTPGSGSFIVGEQVTNSNGETGIMASDDGTLMELTNVLDPTMWLDLDTITGDTSGADGTQGDAPEYLFVPLENDIVIYDNQHYINTTGINTLSAPPYNGANWTLLPAAIDAGYIRIAAFILYDFAGDAIFYRCDNRRNQVWGANTGSFPWGNDAMMNIVIIYGTVSIANMLGQATDLYISDSQFGFNGYAGSITYCRIYDSTLDFTNSEISNMQYLDLKNGATLSFAGSRGQLSSITMNSGTILGTGMRGGNIASLRMLDQCQLNLGSDFRGSLQNITLGGNVNVTAELLNGVGIYNTEITIPATIVLNPAETLQDKVARIGFSNFEKEMSPTGYMAIAYDNRVGIQFVAGQLLTNTTTGGEALIVSVKATYLLVNFATGVEWSDNDALSNNVATTALINGTPNYCARVNYDNRAVAFFTVGESLTDATSGATGEIVYDDGIGILGVKHIVGYINNNDAISGGASGTTADVNGVVDYLHIDILLAQHCGFIYIDTASSQEPIGEIQNLHPWFPVKIFAENLLNFVHNVSGSNTPRLLGGANVSLDGTKGEWIEFQCFEYSGKPTEVAVGKY